MPHPPAPWGDAPIQLVRVDCTAKFTEERKIRRGKHYDAISRIRHPMAAAARRAEYESGDAIHPLVKETVHFGLSDTR